VLSSLICITPGGLPPAWYCLATHHSRLTTATDAMVWLLHTIPIKCCRQGCTGAKNVYSQPGNWHCSVALMLGHHVDKYEFMLLFCGCICHSFGRSKPALTLPTM